MKYTKAKQLKKTTEINQYTEDFCLEELHRILKKILTDKKIWSLNQIVEQEHYTTTQVGSWKDLYSNKEIEHLTKKIKDVLKNRLLEKGGEKKLNSSMAQFIAINNYDFLNERTEQKIDNSIEFKTEELQSIADNLADNIIQDKLNK